LRFGQPLRSRPPLAGSIGMVRAPVSRSLPSGTKQLYGVRSHRLPPMRLSGRSPTPQKPLRADRPVTHCRTARPPKGDGSVLAISAGESRPPAVVGSSSRPHRLSSSLTRSSGRIGRRRRSGRRVNSSKLISSPSAGHRSGGQSMQTGSGVCRSTTAEVEPHKTVVRARSPGVPQFGV
jgi:hypothetical protein